MAFNSPPLPAENYEAEEDNQPKKAVTAYPLYIDIINESTASSNTNSNNSIFTSVTIYCDSMELNADMADDSQRIKALVVRAEDSRLMQDMSTMRRAYTELYTSNKQLLSGYSIRRKTHEDLVTALKDVNNMIQKAANLRVGKIKSTIISECRANVKSNNLVALIKIMKNGTENPIMMQS